MKFEFDPKKSDANKAKHGLNFIEAQELWNDIDYLEIPAKTTDEPILLVIGKIGENIGLGLLHIEMIIFVLFQCGVPEMRKLRFMKAKEL